MNSRYRAVWTALLVTLLALSAFGQAQSGNIFGTVVGNDGAVLPGVSVTLSGVGAAQTQITDSQGRFRFLNLSPATYTLKAELSGYGTATRSGVTVNIGRNAELEMMLNPSVSQTITVTAEAPLLDTRRTGTGATVSEVELEEIPTARDPWVILQQVPGVLMDRMNVGGNESGQQSQFVSKGSGGNEATYSVDGVNTTDMIATGGSSAYYDFGAFEEIQVATGGTDPRVQSPGAQINIVTKRGTNDFSGSGRYYLTDGEYQSDPEVPTEAAAYLGKVNEINEITEWGFEVGGPIMRDRLWGWLAYADNQIGLFVAQSQASIDKGQPRFFDDTILETVNGKLNAQVARNNSAVFFYTNNSKSKFGRNASPTRPPETTWNQGGYGPEGTYKIEDTHIFSSNFYLTGLYSKVNGGFQLWPRGTKDCADIACVLSEDPVAAVLDLSTGEWRKSFVGFHGERPQEQLRADGSAFFSTGGLSHELKFGFGYRTAGAEGQTQWGAGGAEQLILDLGPLTGVPGLGITYFYAHGPYDYGYEYNDLYVGDTMLWGNLTVQAGLRFDWQKAEANDQFGPANPLVTDPTTGVAYLPQLSISGSEIDTMEWNDISPRIGLTYALGAEKRTLVRAAYNSYVGQMGSNSSGFAGVIPVNYRYIGFYTMDANGNDLIETGEILFEYGIYGDPFGFDADNPSVALKTRRVDPGVTAPTTDEFILGVEHELFRDLVVSANFTHREFDNFITTRFEKTPGSNDFFTSADYEQVGVATPPAGQTLVGSYSSPVYARKAGLPGLVWGVITNRPDYTQTYDGLELGVVKRMSNRWMVRGNVSWNDWKQNVGADAIVDPTRSRTGAGCSTCDGSDVVQGSGTISGAKGAVWINSEWAVNAGGVFQIPVIETNLGANFSMRQGYPILYAHRFPTADGAKAVLAADVTEHRLDNPYSLDLRLSKDFRFRSVGLEVSIDAFNVTNEQTILQRNADIFTTSRGATTQNGAANRIRELQSPRILRLGARFTF